MEPTSSCGNIRGAHVRIIPYCQPRGTIEWWKQPRFSSANVSLVIGSRNGKTAGRLDSSTLLRIVLFRQAPFCVWECRSILPPLSPPLVFRAATFIFPLFDLFVYEPFDPAFIRSFTCPPIRSFAGEFVHISFVAGVHCPIILPRSSHLVPTKLFFLLTPC